MNGLAAVAVVASVAAAVVLAWPAARRGDLGLWHPAIAWLALEATFFGLGSAVLAVTDGRTGPAWYAAASVLAFALAVAVSDRIARRRQAAAEPEAAPLGGDAPAPDASRVRWVAVAAMIGVGIVALIPTLLAVGLPALANDITGARVAIGGLDLQVLRVALPAGLVAAAVVAARGGSPRLRAVVLAGLIAALGAELALASRYLAAELLAALVIGLALAGRRLAVRSLVVVGAAAVALFVVVGVLRAYGDTNGRPLEFALERSVNRVVLIQPRTLDALQAAIPGEVPYFGGLTWVRRLAPLFGRDDVPNLGYWIYPRLFPDQATPGYAAPGIVGEAWANFGPLGVVVPFGLGILAERLGAWVALRRRSAVDIATGAVAILFLARTHAVGLTGLAVLAVLVVAWRLLAAPVTGIRTDLVRILAWRA
jgi:hypothetical protein